MVDQNSQFYAILTNVGAAKQANADALGVAWKITQMGVGDANGTDPTPNATQKALLNEWRRAPLNQLKVDDKDNSVIVAEQVIPADVGGFWIREIGLYDVDGDLVAVANCAPTYKPLLNQGSGRTQVVRMSLVVSSSSNVQLRIDPSVVLATREFVTEELARQDFKHSVLVATTVPIALSGLQAIDGVGLQSGNRVLVKDQEAAKDNGIYVAAVGAWTRSPDADTSAKVTPGLLVLVERGAVNGDSAWQLVTDGLITLGVTGLSFEMAFGRTGVANGSYRSVVVDKYGRVVSASNPTTVAGYGLTDVFTKTEVEQALSLKAPLDSPALSGKPKAPTPSLEGSGDNSDQIANTAFVQKLVAGKALNDSPAFSGTPKAPTPDSKSNDERIATTAFVQDLLYWLVGGAPKQLSTLAYLALALGNDPDFAKNVEKALSLKAPLNSPALSGKPKAPTPSIEGGGDNSDQVANTAFVQALLAYRAPLDSPALSGKPKAPTPGAASNDDQIANTAFVQGLISSVVGGAPGTLSTLAKLALAVGSDPNFAKTVEQALSLKAPLNSPALSGKPKAPTPSLEGSGDNSDQIANTTFVQALLSNKAPLASPAFSGVPKVPTAALATNDEQVASTAFVQSLLGKLLPKRAFTGNDFIRIPDVPGGFILQFGSAVVSPEASYELTLPITFNSILGAVAGMGVSAATDQGNYVAYAVPVSNSIVRLTQDVSSRTTAGNQVVYYLAWGN